MKSVSDLPNAVRTEEHVWIPTRDGTRLSARLWIPEGAEDEPVPAVLEYIPYRKRDGTRKRDARMHPYFASHGYVSVRVDLRGSGDSEGVLTDEYLPQELDDGEDVLAWIAAQPWCDGAVGMIGISWGGFNGLQLAARRPPELKAVITASSTDDRYTDDVHYMGGCLLTDNLSWASTMLSYNSLPPDPDIVGERWRQMWLQRLEGSGLWLETWLRHQRRDDYWKHGSICEDYAAVQCPVFAIGGWADGYSNAVLRLMERLDVPRRALIGPWSHMYPHLGKPGPAIGFLQEALRWWDTWLKGRDCGVQEEPTVRVWLQDSVPPTTSYLTRPGRWIAEPSWPSPNIYPHRYRLAPGRIVEPEEVEERCDLTDDDAVSELSVQSPLSVGLFAGKWASYAATPDLPHDQREEDGGALTFDTEPLDEPLEIMGAPAVDFELSSSRPVAMIAVRLSDVAPDDKATRITYGLLNLCHRNSHERPEPLQPGERFRVRVTLNDIAQVFPAGHRLRLSVSTSYWPLAWAPPEPVRLAIVAERSEFIVPVRPPRPEEDAQLPAFDDAEGAPPLAVTLVEPTHHNWLVHRDLARDESTLEVINDDGTHRIEELGTEVRRRILEWYRYRADDFESLRGETTTVRGLRRGEWEVEVVTRTVLTASTAEFYVHATIDAYEGDKRVFAKTWDVALPRVCV